MVEADEGQRLTQSTQGDEQGNRVELGGTGRSEGLRNTRRRRRLSGKSVREERENQSGGELMLTFDALPTSYRGELPPIDKEF